MILNEFKPYIIKKGENKDFIVLCDHASNYIPRKYNNLGMNTDDLESHIAFDIGASDVAKRLSDKLNCNLIMSNFSRLLIDPNRGLDDPTLIPKLSENKIIKGNLNINFFKDEQKKLKRIRNFYLPYDRKIKEIINDNILKGFVPSIISIHSFSPIWKEKIRDIEYGILWDMDNRLANLFLKNLPGRVGDNKPYNGKLKNDTLNRHATNKGLPNVLIEIRQDKLKDLKQRYFHADQIYDILEKNLKEIKNFKIRS